MPADTDFDREFADLAELIREDRREIDPFFARELDSKVAAGFPREPRWRRLFSTNSMLVPGVAASMLLALMVSVAILGGGNGDGNFGSESAGGGGGEIARQPAAQVPETADEDAPDDAALQYER